MQKKFLSSLFLLLLLNFLIKPFWVFGIDRSVQNAVGASEYGFYYALFNFSYLFNILLDLGITNYNNRNISQHSQLMTKHLSSIIVLRLLLVLGYVTVSAAVAWLIGYTVIEFKLLGVLFMNQALISFILYLRSNIAGLQLFNTDSLISVLDRVVMILICGFLLWGNVSEVPFRIEWFVYAQTASYIFTLIVAAIVVLSKSTFTRLKWSPPFFLMILKQSYPYALLILIMTIAYRIDSVMLERMLDDGDRQAGIYAQAYRILDAVSMVAYLLAGLLLPMFSSMLGKKQEVSELVKLSYSLIMVIAIMTASGCLIYRNEIMEVLYRDHVSQSAEILAILMFSFTGFSTVYVFGTLLTADGSIGLLNKITFSFLLFNIGLNLFLIPAYGVTGAALACLFTQIGSGIAQMLASFKKFSFSWRNSLLGKLTAYLISSVLVFAGLHYLNISWILSFSIAAIVCILIAFIINLVNLQSVYAIMRRE